MELLAVILTLLCVWLTYRDLRISWIVGILACTIYGLVFWQQRLYADFGLQIIYFLQGIHGYFNWGKVKRREANTKNFVWLLCMGTVCWFLLFSLLNKTDASYPATDSMLSIFSLVANQALVFHWRQAWLMWVCIDLIYVVLFSVKEMWYSVFLYAVLAAIATVAFKQWKVKSIKSV
jgi:nicotinamide mononucleotide transporter